MTKASDVPFAESVLAEKK